LASSSNVICEIGEILVRLSTASSVICQTDTILLMLLAVGTLDLTIWVVTG
jgi:hypothetical protein